MGDDAADEHEREGAMMASRPHPVWFVVAAFGALAGILSGAEVGLGVALVGVALWLLLR